MAAKLADDIANNRHASGKSLKDYQLDSVRTAHWVFLRETIQRLATAYTIAVIGDKIVPGGGEVI